MINVIIPAYNRINYTLQCIKSLKKQDCVNNLKIFLVDDGSTDNTKEIVSKKFPDVKIFRGNGSLFWGGAVNYGIKKVLRLSKKNDWILLVNNDVEFKSNAISILVKYSNIYKRKAVIGSLSVSFENKKTIIKSGTIVKNWFFNITQHKFLGLNLKNLKKEKPVNVDFLTGRCLLHPVEIFKLVKNYDSKKFPHYGADDEFSMRVKQFGYFTKLCPTSIVYLKKNHIPKKNKIFFQRFYEAFFDIKSSTNIVNKFNLTLKVVPSYAKITFFIVGVIKSFYIFLKNDKKK
tara:strand:- start:14676 stop:15542 length:867 start_codon:yes stop_codon:yes gene_type:complete